MTHTVSSYILVRYPLFRMSLPRYVAVMACIPLPGRHADFPGNAAQQHGEQRASDDVQEAERVANLRAVDGVRHHRSQLVPHVIEEVMRVEPADDANAAKPEEEHVENLEAGNLVCHEGHGRPCQSICR